MEARRHDVRLRNRKQIQWMPERFAKSSRGHVPCVNVLTWVDSKWCRPLWLVAVERKCRQSQRRPRGTSVMHDTVHIPHAKHDLTAFSTRHNMATLPPAGTARRRSTLSSPWSGLGSAIARGGSSTGPSPGDYCSGIRRSMSNVMPDVC